MRTIKSFEEKVADTKLTKVQHGRQVRDIRVQTMKQNGLAFNKKICGKCGFHIRGVDHLEGAHHVGQVPACHRGR